jgi:enamine deaminase RidA (YjgF/YER057c/UK114 family)
MYIHRNPNSIHPPVGPYSHQVDVPANARWLVMSGQVGMRPDRSVPETVAEQFEVALQNIVANCEEAGLSATDVVKLTIYLVDEVPTEERGAILERYFGDWRPTMTLVYVPRLAAPPIKVELDAWAAASD